ncbi:MAG TPA: hypothetical protein VGB63_12855 [Pedobacter sp.]
MSGVDTDVTVSIFGEDEFGFVTHISDEFEGGELTPTEDECDAIIKRKQSGQWEIIGESKIHLSEEDIQSLGLAIERDYLSKSNS